MISDLSTAIPRKQCKIGGKLLLITNRKSHMSFQLVPKSVTLNDLERPNGVISANSGSFRVHCVKVQVRYLISWWVLVFLYMFQKRILGDKWHTYFTGRCPSCHPFNSVSALKNIYSLVDGQPPFPQIDIIGAVVIVWRVRGKTVRSVLCNIVCNNCAQCDAHTYEQTNSSLDWGLSH